MSEMNLGEAEQVVQTLKEQVWQPCKMGMVLLVRDGAVHSHTRRSEAFEVLNRRSRPIRLWVRFFLSERNVSESVAIVN